MAFAGHVSLAEPARSRLKAPPIRVLFYSGPPAVFEALNRMPHQQHGVDIMRVREWALR